jgi:hypothetical protein
MVSKAHMLLAVLIMSLLNIAHAETSKSFKFENQREEVFDLENYLKETRYKIETQDATCYRQEPYIENVCRDVTKYRQQCHIEPGRQYCRTVYDQVCRTENRYENECRYERGPQSCRVVVRYRQECSQTGGGQQCHTEPGRVECHRAPNGENKCEKIPPRQVCSGRPSRQECRQVPYEERECSEGPSRQVCNQVNRPHQVCEGRPRQQCEWTPAQQQCAQVPYTVNECRDETLYNQIPYACKKDVQVPYVVTLRTHQANVQVLFDAKTADAASSFSVGLSSSGEMEITGKEEAGSKAVAFVKRDVNKSLQGDINTIKAIYNVSLYNKSDLFSVGDKGISNVDLNKRSLSFVVNGKFDKARSTLEVKISKKNDTKFSKVLKPTQFSVKFDGAVTRVDVDLESLGAPKLGGVFNKNHTVSLKLKMDYSDVGDLLLPKLGELSTSSTVEIEID